MSEDYDHLFRYIIVGDISVGKSCLMMQFTKNVFKSQYYATLGVEFGGKTIEINGRRIKIQIWDTAGQETFQSITRSYYKGAIGAFLVYDITRRDSFEHVAKWLTDVKQNGSKDLKIILIGNKIDLEEERKVTTEEGKNFATQNNLMFLETSAKTAQNVYEAFQKTASSILEGIISSGIDPTKPNIIKISDKEDEEEINVKKNKCCIGT